MQRGMPDVNGNGDGDGNSNTKKPPLRIFFRTKTGNVKQDFLKFPVADRFHLSPESLRGVGRVKISSGADEPLPTVVDCFLFFLFFVRLSLFWTRFVLFPCEKIHQFRERTYIL